MVAKPLFGGIGGFDVVSQFGGKHPDRCTAIGFGKHLACTCVHGIKCHGRALLRERADDHHSHRRAFLLQLAQIGQAIHARHFHVQGHHIGLKTCDFLHGYQWVVCNPHNLNVRVVSQSVGNGLSDQR